MDRRATVFDDLPEEVVVDKILTRLPPKDVGRCRAVSKSWRSSTSTPEFMHEHHRHQPSLHIIYGLGLPASFVVLRGPFAVGAPTEQLWPFLTRCRKSCCEIRLHAACDGFLIVSRGVQFYICNPSIHTHALLPFPKDSINIYVHGFYRHQSTGEYRVLWSRVAGDRKEAILYVLTLGNNESRSIQVILPTTLPPSPRLTFALIRRIGCSSPTYHGGNLHWFSSTKYIIVFDPEAESFRWMSPPTQGSFSSLFQMEGTLCYFGDSSLGTTFRDVWVMQDYKAQIWALKYRIHKTTTEASLPPSSAVRCSDEMVVLDDYDLLIGFKDKHVLPCDADGELPMMVSIGNNQHRMKFTRHRLQESIMPIPCGEIQEEDEEFPFSKEHV